MRFGIEFWSSRRSISKRLRHLPRRHTNGRWCDLYAGQALFEVQAPHLGLEPANLNGRSKLDPSRRFGQSDPFRTSSLEYVANQTEVIVWASDACRA